MSILMSKPMTRIEARLVRLRGQGRGVILATQGICGINTMSLLRRIKVMNNSTKDRLKPVAGCLRRALL